jgi:hypothetical protein
MKLVENKYKTVELTYGHEAVKFVRKLMSLFAKARGVDSVLWIALKEMYASGEIIEFKESNDHSIYKNKIILKKGLVSKKDLTDYIQNACFGFVNESNELVFAELPFTLYEWNGEINSLTTAIIDIAQALHGETIEDSIKLRRANMAFNLVRSMEIANRLASFIEG